jgi:HEAT repeat protein
MNLCARLLVGVVFLTQSAVAQTNHDDLRTAVDQLGDFDHTVRMEASRTLRRAGADAVLPVLLDAWKHHEDSYVQFRSIVLIYGLEEPRGHAAFEEALDSQNDRVRAAAYEYFEQVPSTTVAPKLLAALDKETSEFVRPYLVRALAANDNDPAVQGRLMQDIDRGQGYFRGAVIEALGDHGAAYAVDSLIPLIAEDGPLHDDALLALGKIGDPRTLPPLRRVQERAGSTLQPIVSAAACLLDLDCEGQLRYIVETLRYGATTATDDGQELVRSASSALAALAGAGRRAALDVLFEVGLSAGDSARGPIALALGTVALRNPELVRVSLVDAGQQFVPVDELLLLRDAFDMLDEDFAEERFYTLMRRDYWDARIGSRTQAVAGAAIQILEF